VTCEGEPVRVSICHCLACQQRTGSAFGVQARFARERVTMGGRDSPWTRVGDDGGRITFHFCPDCGATVYYECDDFMAGHVAIPVGAFADPSFPAPTVSVYRARRHAWTAMPDLHVEELAE
jgi:hypothetical protein